MTRWEQPEPESLAIQARNTSPTSERIGYLGVPVLVGYTTNSPAST